MKVTSSPISSKLRTATTFIDSLSMTSWPGCSALASTLGLTDTRNFLPLATMSTEPSSCKNMKEPKPLGGSARRSTSAFKVTICSRASRRVLMRRSLWSFCAASSPRRCARSETPDGSATESTTTPPTLGIRHLTAHVRTCSTTLTPNAGIGRLD